SLPTTGGVDAGHAGTQVEMPQHRNVVVQLSKTARSPTQNSDELSLMRLPRYNSKLDTSSRVAFEGSIADDGKTRQWLWSFGCGTKPYSFLPSLFLSLVE